MLSCVAAKFVIVAVGERDQMCLGHVVIALLIMELQLNQAPRTEGAAISGRGIHNPHVYEVAQILPNRCAWLARRTDWEVSARPRKRGDYECLSRILRRIRSWGPD